jgi:hypothetical protein
MWGFGVHPILSNPLKYSSPKKTLPWCRVFNLAKNTLEWRRFVGISRNYPLKTRSSKQPTGEIPGYEIIPSHPLKYPRSKQGLTCEALTLTVSLSVLIWSFSAASSRQKPFLLCFAHEKVFRNWSDEDLEVHRIYTYVWEQAYFLPLLRVRGLPCPPSRSDTYNRSSSQTRAHLTARSSSRWPAFISRFRPGAPARIPFRQQQQPITTYERRRLAKLAIDEHCVALMPAPHCNCVCHSRLPAADHGSIDPVASSVMMPPWKAVPSQGSVCISSRL